ncbi:MAG: aminotransferase class I/II-fold pyridoxal phosphate-dependent enzyme, partial [Ruminiclostridium sp.]|nr:aminotransferase class I/II-fold pyridoxal phosphate-dependent enzyme [Ruminiclostridium sp.]
MNYEEILSKKTQQIKFSGIRKFFDIAASVKDVISLSVGEPDFKTPFIIRKEAIRTLEKGKTAYTSNAGLDMLRESIAGYLNETIGVKYDPKHEVIVTVGGSEAIDATFRALLDPGDEVLVCEPSFVCYDPLIRLADGVPVPIETKQENKFKLMPEQLLAAITPKTKALVLPFPNNPTGAVMRREDLSDIAEILREKDIIVISDEIYSELTYGDEKHVSIAEFEGMRERTIVINGFS